jgi:hypothetical protein
MSGVESGDLEIAAHGDAGDRTFRGCIIVTTRPVSAASTGCAQRQDYRKTTTTREPIWYKLLDSVTLFGYITGTLKNCGSGWRGRGMGILATWGRPGVRLARRGGGQR